MNKLLAYLREPRFSSREQALFAKRLAFLMRAEVPILEGLAMLSAQCRGGAKQVVDCIHTDVSSGQSLSRSLAKFPKVFGDFTVHITRIGEASGTLVENLEYLAEELTKRDALRRTLISAFIYPATVALATIGITLFLIIYLFPKITPIFASLHTGLPLSTRVVMAVSDLFLHYGFLILVVGIALLCACFVAVRRNPMLRTFLERVSLRLPLLGGMLRSYYLAGATRTLGLLQRCGVPVAQALSIVAETSQNSLYRAAFGEVSTATLRGDKVSVELARHQDLFPAMLTHMLAVGERSGTFSESLVYLSEMYDAEVDEISKSLSTLIEPALMIVMGLVVGFIAISIITPIYGITQNLHA